MYTKFENNPSRSFWVIALTPLRAAGGGRLRRKTITSPDPSDTGDIINSWSGLQGLSWFRNEDPHIESTTNSTFIIAATGLIMLHKFHPNHQFFSPCDLEIWWWPQKTIYHVKLCASFQIHWWIQTEVTVWKRSIQVKIGDFLSLLPLKFGGWPWKTIGHLFYSTPSFVHHLKSISEFKLELQSRNTRLWLK